MAEGHASAARLNASNTSPNDWRYVSEGGATMVFSYNGPEHPFFSGTVLRLRKIALEQTSFAATGELDETDDPTVAFQDKITSRLMPQSFLPHLQIVFVELRWLQILRTASESARPSERRMKDTVDVRRRRAVLATDLVGGAPLAVEIKPKWGFLPNPTHLSTATRSAKTQRCRYCLHSRYRLIKGEGLATGYCPLDLYSGDEQRIARALRELLKAWVESKGTINNLRIFVDGETVDPAAFEGHFPTGEWLASEAQEQRMEALTASLTATLAESNVLQSLAHLQRTLDPLDIEGLFSLYKLYRQSSDTPESVPPFEELFSEPTLQDWEHFVETHLSSKFQATLNHTHPKPEQLSYYAMAYLLSATFKDCSVIIRFGASRASKATVTVIDLDPKSFRRLKKWAELDHTLVEAYASDGTDPCVDAAAAH